MRAERNDGLATEIILVKERIERLGHIVPPVGKPDEHDIVLVQILDVGSQCRTGIFIRFLFGCVDKFLVRTGISMHRLYLEKVTAGSFADNSRHIFGIPLQLAVRYQSACPRRSIHAIGFGHGKISHENFAPGTGNSSWYRPFGHDRFGSIRTLLIGKSAKDNST